MAAPVFRIEDTDGEPLSDSLPKSLPKLHSLAKHLNIRVNYTGAVNDRELGLCSQTDKSITLYSHQMAVFFHELCHTLHHRIGKIRCKKSTSKPEADPRTNEIVADPAPSRSICAHGT